MYSTKYEIISLESKDQKSLIDTHIVIEDKVEEPAEV